MHILCILKKVKKNTFFHFCDSSIVFPQFFRTFTPFGGVKIGVQIVHILYTPPETFKIPFKVSKKRYPQLLPSVSVRNIRKNTMLLGPAVKRVFPLKKQGGDIGKIDPYTFSSLQYPPPTTWRTPFKTVTQGIVQIRLYAVLGTFGVLLPYMGGIQGKRGVFPQETRIYGKKGCFC